MNTGAQPGRRGAPLLALALVMSGWIALRTAALTAWPEPAPAPNRSSASATATTDTATRLQPERQAAATALVAGTPVVARPILPPLRLAPGDFRASSAERRPAPRVLLTPLPLAPIQQPLSPRLAGGHALMWLAAVAQLPGPLGLLEQVGRSAKAAPAPGLWPPAAAAAPPHRWSADAWAMVRGGGGSASAAPFGPTYGASQVGAVLRYRLAPESGHRPTAYVRATAALDGSDREVAAGLSLRAIPKLPVALAFEGRVSRLPGTTEVRPAVIAITELAPITLPAAVRAEFYAQGGYVGGRAATAFVDGSLRLDRHVAQVGWVELRAGAGAWGGAQAGAQRLDLGPTATLGVTQGRGAARLALDWRLRVAGAAAPSSGPALTISAGF